MGTEIMGGECPNCKTPFTLEVEVKKVEGPAFGKEEVDALFQQLFEINRHLGAIAECVSSLVSRER